jgi:2-methylcitrate dehydratase PrpD
VLDAGPIDSSKIVGFNAEVPAFAIELTEPEAPTDPRSAAWSLSYAAAVALAGELPAGRLRWPPTPMAAALQDRVVIEPRSTMPPDLAVRGQLRLADGSTVDVARQVPYGHPDEPWTDAELVDKAVRLGVVAPDDGAALLDALTSATSTAITGELLDVLRSPTAAAQPTGRSSCGIPDR